MNNNLSTYTCIMPYLILVLEITSIKYVLFSSTLSLGDFKRRCKFKLKFHECCVKCVIREAALVYNQLEAVFRVKSNDFINSPC